MSDPPLRHGGEAAVLVVGTSPAMAAVGSALEGVEEISASTVTEQAAARAAMDSRPYGCVLVNSGPDPLSEVPEDLFEAASASGWGAIAVTEGDPAPALAAGASDVIHPEAPLSVVTARVATTLERCRLEAARRAGGSRDTTSAVGPDRNSDPDSGADADADLDPAHQLRNAFAHANALIAVTNGTGTVHQISPTVETALGYTPSDLEGMELVELVHPDDRTAFNTVLTSLRETPLGSRRNCRIRVRHADGTTATYTLTVVNRLEDSAVRGLVCTFTRVERDVTGESDTETALFDRLPTPAVILEGADLTISRLNPAAMGLFDQEQLAGKPLRTVLEEDPTAEIKRRLDSPQVNRTDPVEATVRTDTTSVTVGITVAALTDPSSSVCLLSRQPPERILTSSRVNLLTAESSNAVEAVLVGAVVKRCPGTVVGLYHVDGELARPRVVTNAVTDESLELSPLSLAKAKDQPADLLEAVVQSAGAQYFVGGEDGCGYSQLQTPVYNPDQDAPHAHNSDRGAAHKNALESLSQYLETTVRAAYLVPVGDDRCLIVAQQVADGIRRTDRDAIDRLAADATARLESLSRAVVDEETLLSTISGLQQVVRHGTAAATRATMEEQVCSQLGKQPWIQAVWIGSRDGDEQLEVRAACSGTPDSQGEGALPGFDVGEIVSTDSAEPTYRVLTTNSPVFVDLTQASQRPFPYPCPYPWRRAAIESDIQAVFSVPLAYDGYLFGALSVATDDPNRLDAVTRALLRGLGETVGFAINALEGRRALQADAVIELEIGVRGGGDIAVGAEAETEVGPEAGTETKTETETETETGGGAGGGAEVDNKNTPDTLFELARAVTDQVVVRTVLPQDGGRTRIIFTVPTNGSRQALESVSGVRSLRQIVSDADRTRYEAILVDSPVSQTIVTHGGVLRSVEIHDTDGRIIVELAQGSGVRPFLDRLRDVVPDAELRARRERERVSETGRIFRSAVTDRLTDRQLQTLRTAYESGFFEWPRESTGETVARSLGVSQPTFARHFRAAERNLYALLFEDG